MFAIRLIGHSWYIGHYSGGIASGKVKSSAKTFPTREEAESAALLFVMEWPNWIGNVAIRRVKIKYPPFVKRKSVRDQACP